MQHQQRGGTVLGVILGVIIGLGAALAVAVYVTKVPVPFLSKSGPRPSDHDEAQRNKNWDPNAPLYGKNPAPAPQAPAPASPAQAGASSAAPAPVAPAVVGGPPESGGRAGAQTQSGDPLGDLARARSNAAAAPSPAAPPPPAAAAGSDPFDYFVQAGAFRTQQDADAQRAKLAMLGWEARVSEREQSGRTVYRVRIGPFGKRDDAETLKQKLDGAGVEAALVRVQR